MTINNALESETPTDQQFDLSLADKSDQSVSLPRIEDEDEDEVVEQSSYLITRFTWITVKVLQYIIKEIRIALEFDYVYSKHGIPPTLISLLANFESHFNLKRDLTTSSIWNTSHHEQRTIHYNASESYVLYKPKCECNPGIPHTNDIHCPRNLDSHNGDGDSDEEEPPEDLVLKASNARRKINAMVGLSPLKTHIAQVASRFETAKLQSTEHQGTRFGTVFIGGPGTGKTTSAKHYFEYLHAIGVVATRDVESTTAIWLSDIGIVNTWRDYIGCLQQRGGTVFIDGAHHFMSDMHHGEKVLDYILEQIEELKGKVVLVLAGHEEGMRKILGRGAGVASLLPNVVLFGDMSDEDLKKLLWECLETQGGSKVVVEDGGEGPFMRVAAKRIGRGRGSGGFENARAVENACSRIWQRQAMRLEKKRKIREEEAESDAKLKDEEASKDIKKGSGFTIAINALVTEIDAR